MFFFIQVTKCHRNYSTSNEYNLNSMYSMCEKVIYTMYVFEVCTASFSVISIVISVANRVVKSVKMNIS
jgi:hypothetical protein